MLRMTRDAKPAQTSMRRGATVEADALPEEEQEREDGKVTSSSAGGRPASATASTSLPETIGKATSKATDRSMRTRRAAPVKG